MHGQRWRDRPRVHDQATQRNHHYQGQDPAAGKPPMSTRGIRRARTAIELGQQTKSLSVGSGTGGRQSGQHGLRNLRCCLHIRPQIYAKRAF